MLNVLWFEDQERLNWKQHFYFYFLDYYSQKSKDGHQKVTSVRPLGCRESAISEVNIKWLKYFLSVGRTGMREGWRKKVTKHLPGLEAGPALSETPGTGFARINLSKTHLYSSKFWDDSVLQRYIWGFFCFLKNRPVLQSVTWYSELDLFLNWAALLSTVYKVIYLSRKHPNWNGTSSDWFEIF